jgi:hypothetical protein
MITSTANVNSTLDKICSAIAAAKRAGVQINAAFEGNFFCCIAMGQNINKTIDLTEQHANTKLKGLLQNIYVVTPADVAMQEAS